MPSRLQRQVDCNAKSSVAVQTAKFPVNDGEQGRQAFVYGIPDSFIDDLFVFMTTYVSGAGHALPSDMGIPPF